MGGQHRGEHAQQAQRTQHPHEARGHLRQHDVAQPQRIGAEQLGVQGLVLAGHHHRHQDPDQAQQGTQARGDLRGDQRTRLPQGQEPRGRGEHRAPGDHEGDHGSGHDPAAAAEGGAEQGPLQAQEPPNHEIPSVCARPPTSSTKVSSRERSPRT
ncbi:hypothetical protein SA11R_01505 [Rothia kristinae]|nr:hypothetical protein SA11R_01505 [Rothia kristinae]KTR79499.1 hypothetical protein RSA28_07920 [Rothia kristinae]